MLNDFEIITRHFPENNDIKIYPISDVHLGTTENLTAEWDNFVSGYTELEMFTSSSYVPQEIILQGNQKEMKVIM